MHLKVSSGKWRPSCLGLNVLIKCCSEDVNTHHYLWSLMCTVLCYTGRVHAKLHIYLIISATCFIHIYSHAVPFHYTWNVHRNELWNHDKPPMNVLHYSDVIMGTLASQITSLTIVYSADYSDSDQRKHQSSASLAFVWGIHRGPVNSPHKWPVTPKMFPFDDVIMLIKCHSARIMHDNVFFEARWNNRIKPILVFYYLNLTDELICRFIGTHLSGFASSNFMITIIHSWNI